MSGRRLTVLDCTRAELRVEDLTRRLCQLAARLAAARKERDRLRRRFAGVEAPPPGISICLDCGRAAEVGADDRWPSSCAECSKQRAADFAVQP
jgi:hypothetical protein